MGYPLPTERVSTILGNLSAVNQLVGAPSLVFVANAILARLSVTQQLSNPTKGYVPPQWGQIQNVSQVIYMAITDSSNIKTYYFFDAVINTNHTTTRQITEHPVQWGANISDHSYQMPARVEMEIGMSDSMACFNLSTANLLDGRAYNYLTPANDTKTKNAYQAFIDLQKLGSPIVLNTRLNRYENMVIESIATSDNYRTQNALRCTIAFKEIFIGKTGSIKQSAVPSAATPLAKGQIKALKSKITVIKSLLAILRDGGVGT